MSEPIPQVWNYGGGTQTAAIAALIVEGRIEAPDFTVIADTGRERSTTWEFLEWLQPQLPITVRRVKSADFATVGLWGGRDKRTLLIPAFTSTNGGIGKMSNFCSFEWKRRVIERYMRHAHGVHDFLPWIGYSTDELRRINPRRPARYPLIEHRLNRGDCIALVHRVFGRAPPRSSCWMCPNMAPDEWRAVLAGPDRAAALAFDRAIRGRDPDVWLTKEAVPLAEANFEEEGDLFGCESGECFI